MTSDTHDPPFDEGAAAELVVPLDTDDIPDDLREELTEGLLLEAREMEDEADDDKSEVRDIEVDDPDVAVEADDVTDLDVEDNDVEELRLTEELDARAEDEAIDEEGVTTTPLTLRGTLRSPSPVDR